LIPHFSFCGFNLDLSHTLIVPISQLQMQRVMMSQIRSHTEYSDFIVKTVEKSSLSVLRHHGLTTAGLHAIFCAVVESRLTYASPAWSGFITTTDRQRVDAFLRCSKRCGFCPADLPEFGELLEKCDDQLFSKIMNNPDHTLHQLLSPQSTASQRYHLRHRTHNRQLPAHHGHLADCNFITRLLYKDTY